MSLLRLTFFKAYRSTMVLRGASSLLSAVPNSRKNFLVFVFTNDSTQFLCLQIAIEIVSAFCEPIIFIHKKHSYLNKYIRVVILLLLRVYEYSTGLVNKKRNSI